MENTSSTNGAMPGDSDTGLPTPPMSGMDTSLPLSGSSMSGMDAWMGSGAV